MSKVQALDEPFGIPAEVEPLPVWSGFAREREDVVIDVVLVGKLDNGAAENREDVGDETLVALGDAAVAIALGALERGRERGRVALEVDDDVLQLSGQLVAGARRGRDGAGAGVGVDAEVRPSRGERRGDDDVAGDTAGGPVDRWTGRPAKAAERGDDDRVEREASTVPRSRASRPASFTHSS